MLVLANMLQMEQCESGPLRARADNGGYERQGVVVLNVGKAFSSFFHHQVFIQHVGFIKEGRRAIVQGIVGIIADPYLTKAKRFRIYKGRKKIRSVKNWGVSIIAKGLFRPSGKWDSCSSCFPKNNRMKEILRTGSSLWDCQLSPIRPEDKDIAKSWRQKTTPPPAP